MGLAALRRPGRERVEQRCLREDRRVTAIIAREHLSRGAIGKLCYRKIERHWAEIDVLQQLALPLHVPHRDLLTNALLDEAHRPEPHRMANPVKWGPGIELGRNRRRAYKHHADHRQCDDNQEAHPATSGHLAITHLSAPSVHLPDLAFWRGR